MFWAWLVIIQLVIFTVLIFFLSVLLTRNVTTATTHLHELNQDYNEKVESATKKKAEVDRYYDEMLLKAKAEAEKQKVTIIKEAHTLEETVIKDARRQGEEIIASANKAAELALGEVDARVQERANVRAAELLTQVLTDQMIRHLHVLWVKDLLKTGLGDVEKLHLPEGLTKVQVQAAFSLTPEEKNVIQEKFRSILGKDLPVEEELRPELIAGLKVILGSLEIDGSLQSRIKEAVRNAK